MINLDAPATSHSSPAAVIVSNPHGNLQGREIKAKAAGGAIMAIAVLAIIILPLGLVGGLITGSTLLALGIKPLLAVTIGTLIPLSALMFIALTTLGLSQQFQSR